MPDHPLANLAVLDQFIKGGALPSADPTKRLLYSPVDEVHRALVLLIGSAQRSLVIGMYGFDDVDLANAIKAKLADPSIYVQLTLDSSQASGAHEKQLLATENYPNSSVAIGTSEKGAIMHLKTAVIDSSIVIHGSTNWSAGGESAQDNELVVHLDPAEAAQVTTRLGAIHTHMLQAAKPAPTKTLPSSPT